MLLHHVMGELEGIRNAWGFVEGGNGGVSMAIARAAESHGAILCTESVQLKYEPHGCVSAVILINVGVFDVQYSFVLYAWL